jgi:small subunit ribosomal protein S6
MRRYETLFIVTPDLSEEELKAVADKVQGVVTGMDGQVVSYSEQGRKKLAYDLKKYNKGCYVLMDFLGGTDLVAEVERNMRLDDRILKYLTVKLADDVDLESISVKGSEPRPEGEPGDLPQTEEAEASEVQQDEQD